MRMSPALGSSSPAMQRRMVVVPHPLDPSSTEIAPARNETVRSEMTSTLPNDLAMLDRHAGRRFVCAVRGQRISAWHDDVRHRDGGANRRLHDSGRTLEKTPTHARAL